MLMLTLACTSGKQGPPGRGCRNAKYICRVRSGPLGQLAPDVFSTAGMAELLTLVVLVEHFPDLLLLLLTSTKSIGREVCSNILG